MSLKSNNSKNYHISPNNSTHSYESKENAYLNSEFLDCAKSLFNILDSDCKGYVTIEELQKHLKQSEPPNIIKKQGKFCNRPDLPSILQQICPANGLINFKRFMLALKIALGKYDLNSNSGIGRSLRPLSFLFAVTESSETESDVEQDERKIIEFSADSKDQICPNESLIEQKSANEEQESMYYHMEEKNAYDGQEQKPKAEICILNQCLHEVSKVADIYNSRLTQLKIEKQQTHLKSSDYNSPSSVGYVRVGFHISNMMKMNQRLHDFQKSRNYAQENSATVNGSHSLLRKMEELSAYIGQIEMEKASLVKDVFHLKAKLSAAHERKDQALPF